MIEVQADRNAFNVMLFALGLCFCAKLTHAPFQSLEETARPSRRAEHESSQWHFNECMVDLVRCGREVR